MIRNGVPHEDFRRQYETMMAEAKDAFSGFCDLIHVAMCGEVEEETVRHGFYSLSLVLSALGCLLAVVIGEEQ